MHVKVAYDMVNGLSRESLVAHTRTKSEVKFNPGHHSLGNFSPEQKFHHVLMQIKFKRQMIQVMHVREAYARHEKTTRMRFQSSLKTTFPTEFPHKSSWQSSRIFSRTRVNFSRINLENFSLATFRCSKEKIFPSKRTEKPSTWNGWKSSSQSWNKKTPSLHFKTFNTETIPGRLYWERNSVISAGFPRQKEAQMCFCWRIECRENKLVEISTHYESYGHKTKRLSTTASWLTQAAPISATPPQPQQHRREQLALYGQCLVLVCKLFGKYKWLEQASTEMLKQHLKLCTSRGKTKFLNRDLRLKIINHWLVFITKHYKASANISSSSDNSTMTKKSIQQGILTLLKTWEIQTHLCKDKYISVFLGGNAYFFLDLQTSIVYVRRRHLITVER